MIRDYEQPIGFPKNKAGYFLGVETWPFRMSQEVSKWLGSVDYNPNLPHL